MRLSEGEAIGWSIDLIAVFPGPKEQEKGDGIHTHMNRRRSRLLNTPFHGCETLHHTSLTPRIGSTDTRKSRQQGTKLHGDAKGWIQFRRHGSDRNHSLMVDTVKTHAGMKRNRGRSEPIVINFAILYINAKIK